MKSTKTRLAAKLIGVAFCTGLSLAARADLVRERCTDDQVGSEEDMKGRNAWALKCGYISKQQQDAANMLGMYWVFAQKNAPKRASSWCKNGLTLFAMCARGCYTPSQRLVFEGREVDIETAAHEGAERVSALSEGSEADSVHFGDQVVASFLAGASNEDVLVIRAASGESIEVTSEHPMVRADGTVVRANRLAVGDALRLANGNQAAITSLEKRVYSGKVWNLIPESRKQTENILAAEGFLSGSARFQNQWADDAFRLSLRNSLSSEGL